MNPSIFRAYDIRGIVGSDFMLDRVYDLGHAIAAFFAQSPTPIKTISLGMDGRVHSPQIRDDLSRALREAGYDVIHLGLCHSPAMYFSLHTLPVDAGLMVTASHNGKEYNGIKLCLGKEPLWGDDIQAIRILMDQAVHHKSDRPGSMREYDSITDYVNWMVDHFAHLKGAGIAAVVDCGNGAGGTVMPQLVKALDWPNVQLLYEEVDGTYPNHEADPTIESNMQDVKRLVQNKQLDVGIGLDGDADRMAALTQSGELVTGDKMLAVFAQQILEEHPSASVVFDCKASEGLVELLNAWGAKPHMVPTGHPYIKEGVKKYKALLAGELSCHFIFRDRYFGYDDGVYAALRLIELLHTSQKTLDELVAQFPRKCSSPELRIACDDQKKKHIVNEITELFRLRGGIRVQSIDGARIVTEDGWGMLRASHTQPALSLRFESATPGGYERLKQLFVQELSSHVDVSMIRDLPSKDAC